MAEMAIPCLQDEVSVLCNYSQNSKRRYPRGRHSAKERSPDEALA